jgi:hypothetical protein
MSAGTVFNTQELKKKEPFSLLSNQRLPILRVNQWDPFYVSLIKQFSQHSLENLLNVVF